MLHTTCPVLANSVDPDQLASKELCEFLWKKNKKKKKRIKWSDWLEIRSGRGILIYSAWQGLMNSLGAFWRWACWLKIPVADLKSFSYFIQKIGFDISCKLSPLETICVKWQSLFSEKNKEENIVRLSSAGLAQILGKGNVHSPFFGMCTVPTLWGQTRLCDCRPWP